jgi:hypothetical protein
VERLTEQDHRELQEQLAAIKAEDAKLRELLDPREGEDDARE